MSDFVVKVVSVAPPHLNVLNQVTRVLKIATAGPRGLPGPPGPTGATGSDLTYLHTQSSPSSSWVVSHNLGKWPSATVFESTGEVVHGNVTYPTINSAVITFSGPVSGKAAFN